VASRDVPPAPPGRSLERDPALVPLSQDHHHALVQALRLREAADGPAGSAPAVAAAFLEHWRDAMAGHFADEEEVLLPRTGALDPAGAARILSEHGELRALVALLKRALAAGEDPRAAMRETGELLRDHVRYEERGFFETVQRALDAAAREELGRAIEAHRAERGLAATCRTRR